MRRRENEENEDGEEVCGNRTAKAFASEAARAGWLRRVRVGGGGKYVRYYFEVGCCLLIFICEITGTV